MRGTVELTARDQELLRACGRFLAVRTGDLCRLFFAGVRRDTALYRLSQLRRAQFLAVTSRSRTEEHIWRLGPAGRAWLRSIGVEPGRCPRAGALPHHTAVVAVWAALAAACHGRPGFRLRQVRPDWELRARPDARAMLVFPDLLVWIETPAGMYPVAVELDRAATEPLAVLRRKLEQYALALTGPQGLYGATELTLLFALCEVGPGRARSIEQLLAAHWSYRSFIVIGDLQGLAGVLDALVQTPQSHPHVAMGAPGPPTRSLPMVPPIRDPAL
jgi:hypothetical protein